MDDPNDKPIPIDEVSVDDGAGPVRYDGGELQRKLHPAIPDLHIPQLQKILHQQHVRSCRVFVDDLPMGSGFLIGAEHVLTCLHVVEVDGEEGQPVRAAADRISVMFALFEDADDWQQPTGSTRVTVNDVSAYASPSAAERKGKASTAPPQSSELDYAVLKLDADIGAGPVGLLEQRGWFKLPRNLAAVEETTPLMVCHQPQGSIIVSFNTSPNTKYTPDKLRLEYENNTQPGSSGSLVSTMRGQPMALHQYGSVGGLTGEGVANHGVPLAKIAKHIEQNFGVVFAALSAQPEPSSKRSRGLTPGDLDKRDSYVYKTAHDMLHAVYERFQSSYAGYLMNPQQTDELLLRPAFESAIDVTRRQCGELDRFAVSLGYKDASEFDPLIADVVRYFKVAEKTGMQAGVEWRQNIKQLYRSISQAMTGLDRKIEAGVNKNRDLAQPVRDRMQMHVLWSDVMSRLDLAQQHWLTGQLPVKGALSALEDAEQTGEWKRAVAVPNTKSPQEKLSRLRAAYDVARIETVASDQAAPVLQAVMEAMSNEYAIVDDQLLSELEQVVWNRGAAP
jgi:hypothetical protein